MNWTLLQNSLLVAAITAVGAVCLGSVVALCALCVSRPWQRVIVAIAIATLALPPFLVTNSWLDLFGANGLLRPWIPFNIFSLGGSVVILFAMFWPVAFLLVWSAWLRLQAAQLEAEPLLRGWALVRYLLWPACRGALGVSLAIVFVLALNNFAVASILQVKVFPAEVWVTFNTKLDAAAAFITSWPMLLAPVLLLFLLRDSHVEWPRAMAKPAAAAFRRQLGSGWFWASSVTTAVAATISVVMPIIQLTAAQRTWTELVPAVEAGLRATFNSALYAGGTALLVLAFGILLRRFRWPGVLWLLFFTPGILIGITFAKFANQPAVSWLYRSCAVVLMAFAIRYLCIGWNIARRTMKSADSSLVDAVRIEGGSGFALFRHALWPQVGAQLACAAYIVYLLCLWEVETMIVIVPPGGETLATRIFNLLHYGHNAHVNALCMLLLGLAVAPLLLWSAVRLWARRPASAAGVGAAMLLATGCSSNNRSDSVEITPIQSSIFSEVQIIGARGTAPGQFNKPRSVALDTNDNLYVVDMTGRVQKFSPKGAFILSWQMPETDLGKPKGMDRDRAGNIVVLEPHYQRVNYFSPEGRLLAQWGKHGTNAGELTLPRAIAIDSKGNVIVSEYTLVDRVQKFSPQGSNFITAWGTPGLAPGEFNRAEGVGVDTRDQIYVADSCNHRIQVFSPEGKFLRAYGKSGTGPGEFSYPYDIRVDEQGRQYVCEFGNSRMQIFDASDKLIETIGKAGANPGEFNNPWSIALDSRGNLYVADSQNHRVQKLIRRAGAHVASAKP